MCWSCFKLFADEPVVNDRVIALYRAIHATDDEASFSPLLHIYVGDMNLEDHWFDEPTDHTSEHYANAQQWERDIFDGLKALTEEERATAVAMEWGYIQEDGTLLPGLT